MKINPCLIAVLLMVALVGQSHAHQRETVQLLKAHTDVFYEQLLKLQHQIDSLKNHVTILRLESILLTSHSHENTDRRCIEPDKFDLALAEIRRRMKDLDESKDVIAATMSLYRLMARVCTEGN